MGRVKRLIRLFEGGLSSLRQRAARKPLFKRSAKASRAPQDRLHRTAQSAASVPQFRRRAVPEAEPVPKAAKTPRKVSAPAKAATPVAQKRAVAPRQPSKPYSAKPFVQRKLWDFGERRPREVIAAAEADGAQPSTVDVQVDARTDDAPADAAAAAASASDGSSQAQHGAQLDAATDAAPSAAEAAPAGDPAAAAASSATSTTSPSPPLERPALPLPPPAETRLLDVAAGFPADDVLWALRCQALCRRHPHILQLREVECRPQQLAVVVDRSVSSMQDLIDGTACKGAPPPEAAVRRLFQQLVVGIAFCHRQGLARASVHPRDLSLHMADATNSASAAEAAMPTAVTAASTAAAASLSAAISPASTSTSDVAGGYSVALKLHDFSAALAAATGGAFSTTGSNGGGGGADQWLCTEQDPSYSAPEVIQARLNNGQLPAAEQAAADVWSAGAVLFALLAGAPPFSRPSDAALPPQPKAVATLLRINTGDRNMLPGKVSEECQDLLRRALQPQADARPTLAGLLGHPWVASGMPPALREVNSRLLAPPGLVHSPDPETLTESPHQPGSGSCKRQRADPPLDSRVQQEGVSRKRAASGLHTLEALLAARVVGPLRQQYGAASAIAAALLARKRQQEAAQQQDVLQDRQPRQRALQQPGVLPAQKRQAQTQRQPLDAQSAAAQDAAGQTAASEPALMSSQPRELNPAAVQLNEQQSGGGGEIQLAPIQPSCGSDPAAQGLASNAFPELLADAASAPAAAAGDGVAADPESPASTSEAQQRPASPPADQQLQPQPPLPSGASQDDLLSLNAAAEDREERDLFDSPSSLRLLLAAPVAGALRLRFGDGSPPPVKRLEAGKGGVHSPLGPQAASKARLPESPLVAELARRSSDGKRVMHGELDADAAHSPDSEQHAPSLPPPQQQLLAMMAAAAGDQGETEAAAAAAAAAESSADDSPRCQAVCALATAMAATCDTSGFQRFSNDSAYRRRAAKAAAGKLTSSPDQVQQADGQQGIARRLPLSRACSGISSDAAEGSPVALSRSGSGNVPAGYASSSCSSDDETLSSRSPVVPRLPAWPTQAPRIGVPLLRLDRVPGLALAPLTETSEASGSVEPGRLSGKVAAATVPGAAPAPAPAAQPPAHAPSERQPAMQPAAAEVVLAQQSMAGPITDAASTAGRSASQPAAAAQAPLRASGAELGDTAALVRLVAASAAATRTAGRGDKSGATVAMWGGASLAQRQERARQHSLRLLAYYNEYVDLRTEGAAVRVQAAAWKVE